MNAILLFLKHPTPGRVKTRLAATVGPVAATAIYREMAERVCRQLPAAATPVVLFDPPECALAMQEWLAPHLAASMPAPLFIPQAPGDLGARLAAAFAWAFDHGFSRVAAIGSDCLELTPAVFDDAFHRLDTAEAVVGPAWDGGYYLIALNQPRAELFANITWSSDRTLADTLERAAENRLNVFLLEKRHDVDTETDWRRAQLDLLLTDSLL